jgi:hypothetical protein
MHSNDLHQGPPAGYLVEAACGLWALISDVSSCASLDAKFEIVDLFE